MSESLSVRVSQPTAPGVQQRPLSGESDGAREGAALVEALHKRVAGLRDRLYSHFGGPSSQRSVPPPPSSPPPMQLSPAGPVLTGAPTVERLPQEPPPHGARDMIPVGLVAPAEKKDAAELMTDLSLWVVTPGTSPV